MAETTSTTLHVAPVTEDNWRIYRDVRLAALLDTPRAFASTYAGTAARDESAWLALLASVQVWLAFEGDRPVGVIALSRDDEPARGRGLPHPDVGVVLRARTRGGRPARLHRARHRR